MTDDFDRGTAGPRDWSQAFATLPMEAAPADAWSRVAAVLDEPPADAGSRMGARRPSRAAWYAMAAAVAAVAVIPLTDWSRGPVSPPLSKVPVATAAAPSATPAPARPAAADAGAISAQTGETAVASQPAAAEPAVAETSRRTSMAGHAPEPIASTPPVKDARRVASTPARGVRTTTNDRPQPRTSDPAVGEDIATSAATTSDPLQPLYAESVQLEALVALARDDRVASASGAVLTGELGARIGVIDALLAQPGLSVDERASLWRQRVAALRQLAGVESTERWLAAHGQALGDALVRVD